MRHTRSWTCIAVAASLAVACALGVSPASAAVSGEFPSAVTVTTPVGGAPTISAATHLATTQSMLALDPAAGVYYALDNSGAVKVYGIADHLAKRVITVAGDPAGLAFDSVSGRLFVSIRDSYTVWVVNPVTGVTIGKLSGVPTNATVSGPLVDSASHRIYTTSSAMITAYDGGTATAMASTTTFAPIAGMTSDPIRGTLDVIEYDALHLVPTLEIFDGASLRLLGRTQYPSTMQLKGIAVDPLSNTAYVGFESSTFGSPVINHGIDAIDVATGQITATMPTHDDMPVDNVFLDLIHGDLYGVTSRGSFVDPDSSTGIASGEVTVFNSTTRNWVEEFQVGSPQTFYSALDPSTGQLHVMSGNYNDGTSATVWVVTPSPAQSVYRFWLPISNDHFFTMSLQEAEGIIRQYPTLWRYEGVAFQAFATELPGTVPLYRFWSGDLQGHFFTSNPNERDVVIASYPSHVWSYEGVDFFVYPEDSTLAGTVEVARFWSGTTQQHFYTINPVEEQVLRTSYPPSVWAFENYNFRVPPAG